MRDSEADFGQCETADDLGVVRGFDSLRHGDQIEVPGLIGLDPETAV